MSRRIEDCHAELQMYLSNILFAGFSHRLRIPIHRLCFAKAGYIIRRSHFASPCDAIGERPLVCLQHTFGFVILADVKMNLREQRVLFTRLLGKLIDHAFSIGYEVSLEEVKRSQLQANANAASGNGIKNSLHISGLAADVNLYRNGTYLPNTEDHKPLGDWWEALHPLNRWGGRFGDGNHYSSTRDGIK